MGCLPKQLAPCAPIFQLFHVRQKIFRVRTKGFQPVGTSVTPDDRRGSRLWGRPDIFQHITCTAPRPTCLDVIATLPACTLRMTTLHAPNAPRVKVPIPNGTFSSDNGEVSATLNLNSALRAGANRQAGPEGFTADIPDSSGGVAAPKQLQHLVDGYPAPVGGQPIRAPGGPETEQTVWARSSALPRRSPASARAEAPYAAAGETGLRPSPAAAPR